MEERAQGMMPEMNASRQENFSSGSAPSTVLRLGLRTSECPFSRIK
jgi:hypothetical protein